MALARAALAACVLLLAAAPAPADRFTLDDVPGEWSGFVGVETRGFFAAPQFPEQSDAAVHFSIVAAPEWYWASADGAHAVLVAPFARGDAVDDERTHLDLRELNYLHVGDGWELRAGVGKVFWGVTESIHLVDIINQDDAVEDVDGEDKLGQPMLHFTWLPEAGALHAFVLPGFRERTFPGARGRLRPGIVIDEDDVSYEADWGRGHVDLAARWAMTLGSWDLGLAHFYGTGRDPRFRVRVLGDEPVTSADVYERLRLAPVYDLIQQTGLDVQYTGDDLLLKLEAVGRAGQGDYRAQAAAGFEYTFYAVFGSDADVGAVGEFLYDSFRTPAVPGVDQLPPGGVPPAAIEDDPRLSLDAPPSPFENDVFAGVRLTLNDVQSTAVLAGAIVDVKDGSRFWTVEASRRLGDRYTVSLDVRLFDGFASDSFFASIERDDFIQLQLARYF